jgi:NAD(P)-dependent dehydrogenase (short-subunit alcohol dehydrogenase family)
LSPRALRRNSGKATVAGLGSHGATVYMGVRSEQKALSAIDDIKKELPEADIRILKIDLASFQSVLEAAREFRR